MLKFCRGVGFLLWWLLEELLWLGYQLLQRLLRLPSPVILLEILVLLGDLVIHVLPHGNPRLEDPWWRWLGPPCWLSSLDEHALGAMAAL